MLNINYLAPRCSTVIDQFFDLLLEKYGIVGTPGEGFGEAGSGFFRLTAFGSAEATAEACKRLSAL